MGIIQLVIVLVAVLILLEVATHLKALVTIIHDDVVALVHAIEAVVVSLVAAVVGLVKKVVLLPVKLVKAILAPDAVVAPVDVAKVD
jgi:hypothetical protein